MADDGFFDLDDPYEDEPAPSGGTYTTAGGETLLPPRESAICYGHEAAEKQFLDLYNEDRVPHALILSGPKGIGKATLAFRIARFLLKHGKPGGVDEGPSLFGDALPATKPETLDVAPEDPVFRQVASGGHPDLLTVERAFDEKKGRRDPALSIDEVRKVNPFLRMTASRAGWRIVIVDDADTMTRNAQNAILKILEEPPSHTLLLLVTHRIGTMVPTIRSRCRTMNFSTLAPDVFAQIVGMGPENLSKGDIDVLYDMTRGSAGQALEIAEEGGLEAVMNVMGLFSEWPRWDWLRIHALAETIGRPGQERSYTTFQNALLWIYEALLRSKAADKPLPSILDNDVLSRLQAHYSLVEWIEICQNLREHFESFNVSNLDKRQAILGAFSLLPEKKAA